MPGPPLSEYEKLRALNIQENRQKLISFGIGTPSKDVRQSAAVIKKKARRSKKIEPKELSTQNITSPENGRRSLRKKTQRIDLLNDPGSAPEDHFLYCNDCNEFYVDGCSTHSLTMTEGSNFISVRPSRIRNAGRGVFNTSKQVIPKDTLLGPYLGHFYSLDEYKSLGLESGYAWELLDPDLNKVMGYIDPGSCPDPLTHWLAMVNTAPCHYEQNLTPLQYRGQIYYRVNRNILPDEELLTYYGDDYIHTLGINKEDFYQSSPPARRGFSCPTCELVFLDELALKSHSGCRNENGSSSKIVEIESTKCYVCETCKHVYLSWRGLGIHMKIEHEPTKEFECLECGKGFASRMKFDSHDCNRRLKLNFKCSHCYKTFSQKGYLHIHIKTVHLKILDHKCPHCDNTFGHKSHLKRHIKTVHLKILDHKCPHCDNRAFGRKEQLNKHVKTVHSS